MVTVSLHNNNNQSKTSVLHKKRQVIKSTCFSQVLQNGQNEKIQKQNIGKGPWGV